MLRFQFSQDSRITSVTDRGEIVRIEFRKQRITIPQVRVMHTQARFENLAALANGLEALARGITMTVVSSQIAKRLLAFEDRCRSNLFRLWPIGGHIGAIPTLR